MFSCTFPFMFSFGTSHRDTKMNDVQILLELCLDINTLFANAINNLVATNSMDHHDQLPTKTEAASPSPCPSSHNHIDHSNPIAQPKDHQLLREYLQDTTFQRKHNLKPLALESLFVGDWSARDDIEPVISLALDHARKDVQTTCAALKISPSKFVFSSHLLLLSFYHFFVLLDIICEIFMNMQIFFEYMFCSAGQEYSLY